MSIVNNFLRYISIVFFVFISITCAGDKEDINLVQPNYIKKSDILGKTWYYRNVVVDSPETSRYLTTGIDIANIAERVVFQIEEDYLIGYRDYEHVSGSERAEEEGNADYLGSPVVAFPITKHFDIIREYNSGTREETNKIVENTSDRYWTEREFIRVSWHDAKFYYGNDFFEYFTDGKGSSQHIQPDDAANPFRARLTPETGFFDVVLDHIVFPDIGFCYYTLDFDIYDSYRACGQGEIKVRHSFLEVDVEQNLGYDPLPYPDSIPLTDSSGNEINDPETGEVLREGIFDRFGFFRTKKITYDGVRGIKESGIIYRIDRFNIWDKSLDSSGNKIPYENRTIRPIVYYLNWDFPQDLIESAKQTGEEWNVVFKEMVATLQNKNIADIPDIFIVKENSCNYENLESYLKLDSQLKNQVENIVGKPFKPEFLNELDHYCSAAEYYSQSKSESARFTWEQIGDIRYNMMPWIDQVVPSGWSGYGPSLPDPVTGRIIQATANVMGWQVNSGATRALEYVDYINDELTIDDIISGSNVPRRFFEGYDLHEHGNSFEEIRARANRLPSAKHLDELERRFRDLEDNEGNIMAPLENGDYFDQKMERLKGTPLENAHTTEYDMILASHGSWRPGDEISDELWEKSSVIYRNQYLQQKSAERNTYLDEHRFCRLATLDDTLIGLARELKDFGTCTTTDETDDDIEPVDCKEQKRRLRWNELRKRIFKAVMLHEIGHNLGLHHNFEGSYDALNYNKKFWEIEVNDGSCDDGETPPCSSGTYLNKEQSSQFEYTNSSIMDYHGRINGDFSGLGLYDKAAIKFGYGQIVETFRDTSIRGGKTLRDYRFFNDYRKLAIAEESGGDTYFDNIDAMYARKDVIFDWTDPSNLIQENTEALLENEVPYLFCYPGYAGILPTCDVFDLGANHREMYQSEYLRYKNYFIFTNFLRNQININFSSAAYRGDRVFGDTLKTYQYFYLYKSRYPNLLETDLGADMAQAVEEGLNVMSEVISTPSPSYYYPCTKIENEVEITNYYPYYAIDDFDMTENGEECSYDESISFNLEQARPLYYDLTYDEYNYTFSYVGNYFDKESAFFYLTYPKAYYVSRDAGYADTRNYSVSFYRLYGKELNPIFLNAINFDGLGLASELNADLTTITPKKIVDFDSENTEEDTPRPLVYPALASNLQFSTMIYTFNFLTSPLDDSLDFSKYMKVVLRGSADDFITQGIENGTIDATMVSNCTLPEGGNTYLALATNDISGMNIAFDAANKCQAHVDGYLIAKEALENAQIALSDADETDPEHQTYVLEEQTARETYEEKELDLRNSEERLLYMKLLNRYVEFGSDF